MREDSGRRADLLAEAFVGLADTLVDDYDISKLLRRLTTFSIRLLPIAAAGILLSDQQDDLKAKLASTEQARSIVQFQLDTGEGPAVECFRTSGEVAVVDLCDDGRRWAKFAAQAGFRAVHAVPLRLRAQTIGALSLFRAEPGLLSPEDVRIGQALADMATIGILSERVHSQRGTQVAQLELALASRVIIEQAKGVLAERCQIDMTEAFGLLRRHARNNNLRLAVVATRVVDGTIVLTVDGTDPRS